MESKKINQLATELAPELSDLTIIGDPTTGISKKITLSQMASLFTGTVEEYANLASFPLVGTADTIYIALDTNIIYRWNTGTSAYVELSPNIVTSLVFNDANGFDGTISLVGSTATLTITTALTTGSIGFIGASGALTQDNSNFFWDNTNKRLGINTNAPTTAIDAFGSGIIGRLNGTSTNNAFLGFASAGSNKWSIGNVQSDHRFRIYSEANTAELVSVLQTGEVGIGIANPLTKLHIFGGASALIANLDANTSVAKSISFRSGNSSRINLEVSGTESGSNAGADFFIRTYSDAGALLNTPLKIVRSTSYSYFATNVIVGGTAASRKLQVNTSGNDGIRISTSNDNPTLDLMQTAAANAGARNWRIVTNWEGWGTLDFQSGTNNTQDPATTRLSISGTTGAATFSNSVGTTALNMNNMSALGSISGGSIYLPYTATINFRSADGQNGYGAITADTSSNLILNNNVGIGMTPDVNLQVKAISGNITRFRIGPSASGFELNQDNGGFTSCTIKNIYSTTNNAAELSLQSGFITFKTDTSLTEKMRISANGNVGIGTVASFILDVWKDTTAYATINVRNPNTTSGSGASIRLYSSGYDNMPAEIINKPDSTGGTLLFNIRRASGAYYDVATFRGDGLIIMPGVYSYNYASTANVFVQSDGVLGRNSSSLKYKKNIEDYSKGLDYVLKLRPVLYESKNPYEANLKFTGFIAEEVDKIGLTELVHYDNNEPDSLHYPHFVALLTKAIQEQQILINELKAKLA